MQPDSNARLYEAVRALEKIAEFVAGRTQAEFYSDELLRVAVERKFTIAGEALTVLRRLDLDMARHIPDLPALVALRDILVHGYAVVNRDVLWRTIAEDIEPVLANIRRLLGPEA